MSLNLAINRSRLFNLFGNNVILDVSFDRLRAALLAPSSAQSSKRSMPFRRPKYLNNVSESVSNLNSCFIGILLFLVG